MADDYDIDIDELMDLDGDWLYVDDEYDLADELAEGQVANPGYSGTNYEIDIHSYELDLYGYWDDLEYGDDAYWDDFVPYTNEERAGQKRKRVEAIRARSDKRQKGTLRTSETSRSCEHGGEPLVFHSRTERTARFFRLPPLLETKAKFAFLPNWREYFADEDGLVRRTQMPAAMRRAAEGEEDVTPQKKQSLAGQDQMDADEEDEGWEDDEEADDVGDDEESGIGIDPDMLKTILQQKLGAAGLEGMDEQAFMQTIQKMMSGKGDDATGDLADALLGKLTSGTGDSTVSNWLSQQGVSFEEDGDEDGDGDGDDNESAGKADPTGHSRSTTQQRSPSTSKQTTQMPLHSSSPSSASKKRSAPVDTGTSKKQKKVKFETQEEPAEQESQDVAVHETSHSQNTTSKTNGSLKVEAESSSSTTRKRKATDESTKPTKRKKNKELEALGAPQEAPPSPAPPARRTRSARAKKEG